MRKRSDFTLVELAIVIACFAMLAAVFNGCGKEEKTSSPDSDGVKAKLAALEDHVREKTRSIQCHYNQLETAKILQMAVNDNRDILVSGTKFGNFPGKEAAWTRYLYGGDLSPSMKGRKSYIQDMTMLRCPSFKCADSQALGVFDAARREAALKEAYGLVYSDSVDAGTGFAGFDFRGSKFEKSGTGSNACRVSPNKLILGGCASKTAPYDTAGALLYNGSSWENKLVKIHRGRCNVFFRDGHVEGLTQTELEQRYLPSAVANRSVPFTSAGWAEPDK